MEPQHEHLLLLHYLHMVRMGPLRLPRLVLVSSALLMAALAVASGGWFVVSHRFARSPERHCLDPQAVRAARELLSRNKTFVLSVMFDDLFGGQRIDFSPDRGVLLMRRSRLAALNVKLLRSEVQPSWPCFDDGTHPWQLQWELFGYGPVVYNALLRELGSGVAANLRDDEIVVLAEPPGNEAWAEWLTFKVVLLALAVLTQGCVAAIARTSLMTPRVIAAPFALGGVAGRVLLSLWPVALGAASLYGVTAALKELLEDSWLALLFVVWNWIVAQTHIVFVRTLSGGIVFEKLVQHVGTGMLIYFLQLYSLGLRYQLLAVACTVTFAVFVCVMVFVELPAVSSGFINEEHAREGLVIRRFNLQLVHPHQVPPQAPPQEQQQQHQEQQEQRAQ